MIVRPQRTIINKQQPKIKFSFIAIASLVCGCSFLLPMGRILGIIAIILGVIALAQRYIYKQNLRKGAGFAIGGILLGFLSLVAPTIIGFNTSTLLKVNIAAQESAAAAIMRSIYIAEASYKNSHSAYATLDELGSAGSLYIDSSIACARPPCSRDNHIFNVVVSGAESFFATAKSEDLSSAHTYYIDEDGVLCRSDAVGTIIPQFHTDIGCPEGFLKVKEIEPVITPPDNSEKKSSKEKPWRKKR